MKLKNLLTAVLIVAILLPIASPVFADATYVVQAGDNLFRISLRFGVTVAAIKAANGLTSTTIYVGQRLTIPGVSGSTATSGTTPSSSSGTSATYTVLKGDNLYRIGLKFGVTVAALKAANGLTSDVIYVGQRLVIPGGGAAPAPAATPKPGSTAAPATAVPTTAPSTASTYTVLRGDTLWGIAAKFNVTVAALKTANGLTTDTIFPGQVLKLPGGSTPPQPTTAPGVPTTKPPTPAPSAGFELGGQVAGTNLPDKMKYAGMAWVKNQVRWSPTAKASDAASLITNAHAQGYKVLLSVVGNPADISGGANFDNYAFYVGELARLGADGIEVWNEMNLDREWPAGQINPVTYVTLLQKSYAQIKAKNANTLVISGAPSPTGAEGAFGLDHVWNDDRYVKGMAAAGAANYADCIGVHYNEGIVSPTQSTGDPRDNYYTRYYPGMVSTYYNAFGGARKLCFTELGYLTSEGYGSLPSFFGWASGNTVAEQAQWLGEAANLAKNGGVVRLMVVFNVDFTVYGEDPQAGFAILRPGGGCPACDSLRAVTGGR